MKAISILWSSNKCGRSLKATERGVKEESLFLHTRKLILLDKTFLLSHHEKQFLQDAIPMGKWMLIIDSEREERAASSSGHHPSVRHPGGGEQASASPDNSQSPAPFCFERHHSMETRSSVINLLIHSLHYDWATTLCYTWGWISRLRRWARQKALCPQGASISMMEVSDEHRILQPDHNRTCLCPGGRPLPLLFYPLQQTIRSRVYLILSSSGGLQISVDVCMGCTKEWLVERGWRWGEANFCWQVDHVS